MSTVNLNYEDFEKALQVKSIIETEFNRHYTAAKLAHMAGTNELKLRTAFKIITGEPLYHYRTLIRMDHAKKLLQTTDLSMKIISNQVGLDKRNFNRQFKRLTGNTPKQWRNEHYNDQDQLFER
jgi:AraC family transcriptional regulator, transcriptional activator for feuABC-ybbA operon